MTKETTICDLCDKQVQIRKTGWRWGRKNSEKPMTEKNMIQKYWGIAIELGFSENGWGSRMNLIERSTYEICDDCYKVIQPKMLDIRDTINKLRMDGKKNENI